MAGEPAEGPHNAWATVGSELGLLERERELAAIQAAAAGTVDSQGRLLLVEGAAGVGKSRLLDAADALARGRGLPVMRARCSELEAGFSFGCVLQLMEPILAGMTADERNEAFSGVAELAAPLFGPTFASAHGSASGDSLFPLVHGLYWLTVYLSSLAGMVILVDDAQWCDDASLRYLSYLARRSDGLSLTIVIASRRAGDGVPSDVLADLHGVPGAARLTPASLSTEAVEVLVRQRVAPDAAPEFCASCAHTTGGNPFLLHELLTEIRDNGLAADANGAARVERLVPQSVVQAVVARITRLPSGATDLARAAAVLGQSATLHRCALVADLDHAVAERVSQSLIATGIFDARSETTFSHPLIRSTIEKDMSGAIRTGAHWRAARVLYDQHERVEIVAAHLLGAAGAPGEPWMIETLRTAAQRALVGGNSPLAVALLTRARAVGLPPDLRGPVLAELGQAQAVTADPGALETLEEAVTCTPDPSGRAAILRRRGDLLFAWNRAADAVTEYNRGLAGLSPDSREARDLEAARAVAMATVPGWVEEAMAGVSAIVDRQGRDTSAERGLIAQVALRMAFTGEPRQQVRALAGRAWADGALLDDEGPDGHVWSLVAGALSFSGYFADAISIADRVLASAQRTGSVLAFASASYARSFPYFWCGRLSDATADIQRALDAQEDGWSAWVGSASFMYSRCLIELGELDQAESVLVDPEDPRWTQSIEVLTVLLSRANMHLVRGRNAQALIEYVALGERCANDFGVRSPLIMPWHNGAALAALRLGELARAEELVNEGAELAERFGVPGPIGRSRWIAGLIAGGSAGLDLMRQAVDVLAGTEDQLEYLYALVEMGSALRRADRRAAAREPLMEARELANRIRATSLEHRATSELHAAGARPRRIERSGAGALTPSEQRIAAFAARGMTNRQIAESLFITPKAVEFHLANAYRKLDIRGRQQLASLLGDLAAPAAFVPR